MGRGQWGEGFTGSTIKDTWTKSRGRVEVCEEGGFSLGGVERWGEKVYNFNLRTIKIKKIYMYKKPPMILKYLLRYHRKKQLLFKYK